MSRNRILVLFAHPALEKSRVNRLLIDGLDSIEGVTFHDLYEAYPDLDIDVAREQKLLGEHDIVVFQHPLFWYSTPAILKEWQDLVLTHGWAYGTGADALHGKTMLSAVSTGGTVASYQKDGYQQNTVRDFLLPIAQTASLCGMRYLAPFVAHGTLRMPEDEIQRHAKDYRRLLEALRDGAIDFDKAADRSLLYLNENLDAIGVKSN